MTFSEALDSIKSGSLASRAGWNGKGQFIKIGKDVSFYDLKGNNYKSGDCIVFVGKKGIQVGWLASQADMLADDWKVM